MKVCVKCATSKSVKDFHLKRGKPQAQCKTCRAKYMSERYRANIEREKVKRKKWYEANKDRVIEQTRKRYFQNSFEINLKRKLRKYNLSVQDYENLLETQGKTCANTGCESIDKSKLVIDHCHITGAVRGLLCNQCNTALGLLKESHKALSGLSAYLDKYKK